MPDVPPFVATALDVADLADQAAHGVTRSLEKDDFWPKLEEFMLKREAQAKALGFKVAVSAAGAAGELLHLIEVPLLPIVAAFVAPTVQGLFGAKVNEAMFAQRMAAGSSTAAAQSIVDGFAAAITGTGNNDVTPSQEPSKRLATAAVQAALESTFNGILTEIVSDFAPEGFGHFTALTELPENIIRSLGVSRLVRRALSPLIDATCATPARWDVEKRYRTQLLGASTVARLIARHPEQKEKWLEDLRRTGYSEQRIEALLQEQRHFFSASDVRVFTTRQHWTHDRGLQHLKDQGFDPDAAEDALRLAGLQRIDELETAEANAIVAAYVARDIDDLEFRFAISNAVSIASERALLTELAQVRRAMNVKHLSASQAAACVRAQILSFVDYRRALEREGYDADAATALELLLRKELDDQKRLEEHRAELEAERAQEQAARDADLAAKKAAAVAARALARRGTEADLERAVVRGVVPIARLEEVYAAHYDPDTIDALVTLVEQDRQAYLDQQAARDAAAQRGKARGVDVGALEQAVLEGVLTLDEFRARLVALNFSEADAELLTATLAARVATRDAALEKRKAAEDAARKRSINLAIVETLVRRGHRTLAYYAQLLEGLGFDAAAIADMTELLALRIADDTAARTLREQTAADDPVRGLSLEQARRAVVLELRDLDWFQRYLFAERYSTEAQRVLIAELQHDVDEARAARDRRTKEGPAVDAPRLSLSVAARAARLGVIAPAAYQARLVAAGYTPEDVDVEMDLLVLEIAEVQAARAKQAAAPAPATPRELSLADVERAVKTGQASIGDYITRAITLGYTAADAQLLASVVSDELETLTAARKRRDQIGFELAAAGASLADLEAQVKAGALPLAGYGAQLEALGIAAADAELLTNLLLFNLASAPPAA